MYRQWKQVHVPVVQLSLRWWHILKTITYIVMRDYWWSEPTCIPLAPLSFLKSIGQLIERGITLQKPLIKVSCNSANLYSPPCAPSNKFAGVEVFAICQSVRGLSLSAHLLINKNTVRMAHKNLQKWVKLVNVISQSINYLVG